LRFSKVKNLSLNRKKVKLNKTHLLKEILKWKRLILPLLERATLDQNENRENLMPLLKSKTCFSLKRRLTQFGKALLRLSSLAEIKPELRGREQSGVLELISLSIESEAHSKTLQLDRATKTQFLNRCRIRIS